jgi:hypothetical protein
MRRTVNGETFDAVHEVYYNADGSVTGWTENGVSPTFHHETDSGDIRSEIERFLRACDQPVLDWETGKEV